MTKWLRPESDRGRRHQPDVEALSQHLDGRLDARRAEALAAHVVGCAACTAVLAELRSVRDALQSLPEVDAPRSFHLRQADVGVQAPARRAATPLFVRWAPALGGLAAIVFVVVLGADLASRGGGSDQAQLSAGRAADESTGMLAADRAPASAEIAGAPPANTPLGAVIVGPDTGTSVAPSDYGDSAAPDAAPAPTPATAGAQDSFETIPQSTPCDACYQNLAAEQLAPTGPPPDGDVAVPSGGAASPAVGPGQPEPATPFALETKAGAIPQPAGTQPAERIEEQPISPTGELQASSRDAPAEDSGNTGWLLAVEIAAAAVAIAGLGGYAAWRLRRKGELR